MLGKAEVPNMDMEYFIAGAMGVALTLILVAIEGQIENWAQDRQKPDRDQPESRGARISFVEQGVN